MYTSRHAKCTHIHTQITNIIIFKNNGQILKTIKYGQMSNSRICPLSTQCLIYGSKLAILGSESTPCNVVYQRASTSEKIFISFPTFSNQELIITICTVFSYPVNFFGHFSFLGFQNFPSTVVVASLHCGNNLLAVFLQQVFSSSFFG